MLDPLDEEDRVKTSIVRFHVLCAVALVLGAADQPPGHAALEPKKDRHAAPELALEDSAGKTMTLKNYRGKVVLLDFWATWCHGCVKEIPWFADFEKTYGAKGLAVVGVSMDKGGWNVVKPFLAENQVPYRMLLGNEATAKRFGIESLPDTFLIDRKGKVAAAYRATLVDKDDVEVKIKALLAKK
jgi:cytochrome c biogenesis protein CcmG/thiol:disulfide interchange protein DsbE